MTSWGQQHHIKKLTGYLYQTNEGGFCSLFNNLFYNWLICEKKKISLYCLDKPSPLSLNAPFFQPLLQPIPYLQFINYSNPSLKLIPNAEKTNLLYGLSEKDICEKAKRFFQWTPSFASQLATLPVTPTIGVHIRAGDKITTKEMLAISIDTYIQTIASLTKEPNPIVFVMSDTFQRIEELKQRVREKGLKWEIHHFPPLSLKEHVQLEFNLQSKEEKYKSFLQFMSELQVMRECPSLVCSLSSNVGRWLYMVGKALQFKSVDIPKFSPI